MSTVEMHRTAAVRDICESAITFDAGNAGNGLTDRAWLAQSVLNILDGKIDGQFKLDQECECNESACVWCEIHGETHNRDDENECTCAITESSMVSCPSHGYDAPES